jgi:hypothetical protein
MLRWFLGGVFFFTIGLAVAEPLADPTRPLYYSALPAESHIWQLSMIHYSKQERFALLNEEFVHEGDSVGAFRVLQIGRESVWLGDDKQRIEVPLVDEIKVPL